MNTISVDEWPGISGKVKKRRREYELELQISVIQWADLQAKCGTYPELKRLLSIPNGIWTTTAQAKKAKASGLRTGVPDLHLPVSRGGFHSLWMELKHGDNKESAAQSDWLDWLHSQGHFCATCRTFDAATGVLAEYLDGRHERNGGSTK